MSNYSKFIASMVTWIIAWATARWGLPAEWAAEGSDMIVGITGIIASVLVWWFPNTKSST